MGHRETMPTAILSIIKGLRGAPRQRLLEMWQEWYGKDAPSGIRRELLVPFLAYRIQEKAHGGLKPSTRAELRRVARVLEKNPASPTRICRPKPKPGTRIVRQWHGQTHEVLVTESGYEYRGASYRSLSQIVRKITGTRWSGPAFFGLNAANSVSGRPHD